MKTHRNKFKRVAIILAAVVFLLLLFAYSYLALRKYNAYRNTVHGDANFIIKVDADQLYCSMALDYLGNPSFYRGKNVKSTESGLSIPAQFFVYTVKSKSAQTYFCAMPVADTLLLRKFVRQKLGVSALKNMGQYVSGKSANGRLTIAFNANTFAIGYSFKRENVEDIIADLINGENMLSDKDQKLVKLKALKSHLAYVFDDYMGTGDFKDGQLHIEGDFNLSGFTINEKTFSHRVFDKDAAVKMWLNVKPSLNERFGGIKVKDYELYPDSLLKYCNSYFDLEMGNPVSQTDTVITYLYNDDFEKEETITSRIEEVPGINSVVSGNATGLFNYLSAANMVKGDVVNKEFFPLYKLYLKRKENELVLSTNQHVFVSDARENTPYFFYLDADFDKLKSQGQFTLFEKYITQLNRLIIKAVPERTEKAGHIENGENGENAENVGRTKDGSGFKRNHFEIDLYFKRKDVNALGQLR